MKKEKRIFRLAIMAIAIVAVSLLVAGCGGIHKTLIEQENYPDGNQYTLSVEVFVNEVKAKPAEGYQYAVHIGDKIELRPVWSGRYGSEAPPNISYEAGVQDNSIVSKTGDTIFVATRSGETILFLRAHRNDPFGWVNNIPIKVF